jgi:hypothetical protein
MNLPYLATVPFASATSLATGNPSNIVSLVLGAGNWLCWGFANFSLSAATATQFAASLSIISGALAAQPGNFLAPSGPRLFPDAVAQLLANLVTVTGVHQVACGPVPVAVSPNQNPTLFLVASANFSVGNISGFGSLFALPLPPG